VGEKNPNSIIVGLFIQSLNEVIDLHTKRVVAGLQSRIPTVIWLVLYAITVLAMAEMGYQTGLAGKRRPLSIPAVALAFSAVMVLIADDHLVHVLSARSTWKTSTGTWSVEAGETIFFRKGAFVLPPHIEENLCILIFFLPDSFVRETVRELAPHLPVISRSPDARDVVIRVNNDVALSTFFDSILAYLANDEQPPEALLKLKAKELLTGILVNPGNQTLSAYLRSLAICDSPSLPAIMEANFCHNLRLEAFAKMCHRSLSSFKREFRQCYGIAPDGSSDVVLNALHKCC